MSVFVLPNRDQIKAWTCPHCRREMDAYRKVKHLGACPKQPATLKRLAEVLPDPDNPTVIIPFSRYKALAGNNGDLPSGTIMFSTWGEWVNVAHAFGLITDDEFEQTPGLAGLHPVTIAELRRLSVELYEGAIGPSLSDYEDLKYRTTCAQSSQTIYRKFGTWGNALAAVGLQHESGEFYWNARKQRRDQGKAKPDPEVALNAPLRPDERLTDLDIPERPIPVIWAQPTPDKLGMIYKLPKLPDDIAPRVYGHVIGQVIETVKETRYTFR